MPYVSVPKDLFAIKTKFMFNLTKRQVTCFAVGAGVGLLLYFTLKQAEIDTTISSLIMMAVMSPFFLFAMYEKNGKPLEVILEQLITYKFLIAKERPYQTKNIYTLLEEQDRINKEVERVVNKNQNKAKTKQGRKETNQGDNGKKQKEKVI